MEKPAKGAAELGEAESKGDCTEREIEAIFMQKEKMGFSKKTQEFSEAILPMLIMLKG